MTVASVRLVAWAQTGRLSPARHKGTTGETATRCAYLERIDERVGSAMCLLPLLVPSSDEEHAGSIRCSRASYADDNAYGGAFSAWAGILRGGIKHPTRVGHVESGSGQAGGDDACSCAGYGRPWSDGDGRVDVTHQRVHAWVVRVVDSGNRCSDG